LKEMGGRDQKKLVRKVEMAGRGTKNLSTLSKGPDRGGTDRPSTKEFSTNSQRKRRTTLRPIGDQTFSKKKKIGLGPA